MNEASKVKIYRAQPAFTNVIRTDDYSEDFHVVYAFVDKDRIREADNPGEYKYIAEPIEAKPSQIADPDGNLRFIRR